MSATIFDHWRAGWARWLGTLAAVSLSLGMAGVVAVAQPAGSQVGYVYPAGCRQGTTVTVIVGGRQLQGVDKALISGTGVTARVMGHDKPLANEERLKMREELVVLRKQKEPPPPEGRIAELQAKLATMPRNEVTPALAETVTLEVSAAADAEPGPRDLRLLGRSGLSVPLVFVVGDVAEAAFPAVSATTLRAAAGSAKAVDAALADGLTVTPPVVVNGQILAGEADRIRFTAKKGQRLIVAVHARVLTPYLADAVPGWFQAVATLFAADGQEVAYADDFRFQPDPVLAYQIKEDGEYTLVVRDALYRGREDFGYRVAIGELPFVAGIYPLGGVAGREVEFALNGWNLPAPVRRTRLPEEAGEHRLELGRCGAATGTVRVAVDALPEHEEAEPNDDVRGAQKLTVPAILNGRIARAGDADWVRFEGRAGQALVLEVTARRLRSPLDGNLQVVGADGAVLATNDDNEDLADGLTTHHADPRLVFTPPADGVYFVRLGDAQGRGAYDYAYRLRLSAPRPDFALRVVPSSVNVRAGAGSKVTVHALRRDGFTGEIGLVLAGEAEKAGAGFSISPASIPAGADRVEVTLSAGREQATGVTALELDGVAMIGGERVRRAAVPADDRMQAFFYRHLVPAQEWRVAVRRAGAGAK